MDRRLGIYFDVLLYIDSCCSMAGCVIESLESIYQC